MQKNPTKIVVLMGVSASGKSTVGQLLSKALDIPFYDGDDYHPQANKDKMASGQPLDDQDRQGWLESLNALAKAALQKEGCILACSALKESYREILSHGLGHRTDWVMLHGDFDLLRDRMQARSGHFMPQSLLQSQFDNLEKPEYGLHLDVQQSLEAMVNAIVNYYKQTSFGLIGLGVMGSSLARNLAGKGVRLSLFNRHVPGKEENVAEKATQAFNELADAQAFDNLEAFVLSMQRPRKIFMMINAGNAVDAVLDDLIPFLDAGDVVMDGGNSHYADTLLRMDKTAKAGIRFLGVGVSGGEEGALQGPAIMPGGDAVGYQIVKPYLRAIAARDRQDLPCTAYIGKGGSGHFVKMVHNGMEYAEMQLLAELYQWMRFASKMSPEAIAQVFEQALQTEAESYLLEITTRILKHRTGDVLTLDDILDQAANKGTGNWTTVAASQLGEPATVLTAALNARYVSANKDIRVQAAKNYDFTTQNGFSIDYDSIFRAYQSARWIVHHQGFSLMHKAATAYHWELDFRELARIWTNGCIIRSRMMEQLAEMADGTPILLHPFVVAYLKTNKEHLKNFVLQNMAGGWPIPCFSAALDFINAFTQAESPANLIQAQRDFFGAHGYRRKSDHGAESHHTLWTPQTKT
ncbi:MAG: NADP-dependent phosphogluconate dehydrogenase [Flavobacteriaceae bacterium]|nr:NADP-dependent phosphogluconate dehydrogenase [Flavobacteriaceae bacterium]